MIDGRSIAGQIVEIGTSFGFRLGCKHAAKLWNGTTEEIALCCLCYARNRTVEFGGHFGVERVVRVSELRSTESTHKLWCLCYTGTIHIHCHKFVIWRYRFPAHSWLRAFRLLPRIFNILLLTRRCITTFYEKHSSGVLELPIGTQGGLRFDPHGSIRRGTLKPHRCESIALSERALGCAFGSFNGADWSPVRSLGGHSQFAPLAARADCWRVIY